MTIGEWVRDGEWTPFLAVFAIGMAVGITMPRSLGRSGNATEYEVRARQWADRIGLRITGVECGSDGMCAIVADPNRPILVDCGQSASGLCVLKAQ